MAHLKFIGYTNISEIFEPQEIKENRIPKTVVSTNVRKMKKYESKIRKMAKGESLSKDCSKPSHHSRLSSSNIKMYV